MFSNFKRKSRSKLPLLPFLLIGENGQRVEHRFASDHVERIAKNFRCGRSIKRIRRRIGFFAVKKETGQRSARAKQLGNTLRVGFPQFRRQRAKKGSLINDIEARRSKIIAKEISPDDVLTQIRQSLSDALNCNRRKIDRGDFMAGAMKGFDGLVVFAATGDQDARSGR